MLPHKHARKDQNVFIILHPVIISSWSAAAKPKGLAKSPDAGRRHRDRQLPCKAADVLQLNPLKPSLFGVFIPAPTPAASRGVSGGSRLEPNRQSLSITPPVPQDRWIYSSPASCSANTAVAASTSRSRGKTAKQRGGGKTLGAGRKA